MKFQIETGNTNGFLGFKPVAFRVPKIGDYFIVQGDSPFICGFDIVNSERNPKHPVLILEEYSSKSEYKFRTPIKYNQIDADFEPSKGEYELSN